MTSPMIRYFEKIAFNYMILVAVGAAFTFAHAYLGMWSWFCVGLGITVGSMYVAITAAMEVDAQKEITQAIEEARQEKVKQYYKKDK